MSTEIYGGWDESLNVLGFCAKDGPDIQITLKSELVTSKWGWDYFIMHRDDAVQMAKSILEYYERYPKP